MSDVKPEIEFTVHLEQISPLMEAEHWLCAACGEKFHAKTSADTHVCRQAMTLLDNYALEAMKALLQRGGGGGGGSESARDAADRLTAEAHAVGHAMMRQRVATCAKVWGNRKTDLQRIRDDARLVGDHLKAQDAKQNGAATTASGEPLIIVPTLKGVQ